MASRQLKASAAAFTPVTPSPWPAAGFFPPQPIMFPFAAANVAVPGITPGSLEQVATGGKGHCQAAPHWQLPADSTGMTVILDGSDEFAVKEGYYPAGLFIPGPVYLAQTVTYKRLAGPPVPAALMMPPFCQRVPAPTAGHQQDVEHHGHEAQRSQLQQPHQETRSEEVPRRVLLESASQRHGVEAIAGAAAPAAVAVTAQGAAAQQSAAPVPNLPVRHDIREKECSSPTQTESSQKSEDGGFTKVLKGAARTPLGPARSAASVPVTNMFGDLALSESDGGSSSVQSIQSRKRKSGAAGTTPHVRFETLSPERTSRRPRSEHFEGIKDGETCDHRSKFRAAGVRQVQIAGATHPERREDDAKKRRERRMARRRKRRLSAASSKSSNSDHDASYVLHQHTYADDADGNDSESGDSCVSNISCVSRLTGPMSEYSGGLSFGSDVSVSDWNSRASSFSARSVTSDSVADATAADDIGNFDGPVYSTRTVDGSEHGVLSSQQPKGDQKREKRPTSILQRAATQATAGEHAGNQLSRTMSAEREWFANWLDASRLCASPTGRTTQCFRAENEQEVVMDGAAADDGMIQDAFSENARTADEGGHEQDEPLVPPPAKKSPTRERIIASKIAEYLNAEYLLKNTAHAEDAVNQSFFAVAAHEGLGSRQHGTTMKIHLPVTSCKTSSNTKCYHSEESCDDTDSLQVMELTFEESADHLLKFLKSKTGETYIQTQLLSKMLRIEIVVDAHGTPKAQSTAGSEACDSVKIDTIDFSGAVHVHLTLIDDATPANLKLRIQQLDADTVTARNTNTSNENPFVGSIRNASLFEQAMKETVPTGTTSHEGELKRAVVLLNRRNAFQREVRVAAGSTGDDLVNGGLVDVKDEAWWGDQLARMKDILMMLGQRRQQHIDSPVCECRLTRNTNAQADPLWELAHIYAAKKEEIEANLRALHSKSSTEARAATSGNAGLQQHELDSVASSGKPAMVIPPSNTQQMKYVPRVAAYWYLLRSFLNLHLREAAVERDLFINHLPNRFYTSAFAMSNLRPSVTEFATVTAPGLCAKLRDVLDAKLKAGHAGTREAQQLAMILEEAMDLYVVGCAKLHGKTEVATAEQMKARPLGQIS